MPRVTEGLRKRDGLRRHSTSPAPVRTDPNQAHTPYHSVDMVTHAPPPPDFRDPEVGLYRLEYFCRRGQASAYRLSEAFASAILGAPVQPLSRSTLARPEKSWSPSETPSRRPARPPPLALGSSWTSHSSHGRCAAAAARKWLRTPLHGLFFGSIDAPRYPLPHAWGQTNTPRIDQ